MPDVMGIDPDTGNPVDTAPAPSGGNIDGAPFGGSNNIELGNMEGVVLDPSTGQVRDAYGDLIGTSPSGPGVAAFGVIDKNTGNVYDSMGDLIGAISLSTGRAVDTGQNGGGGGGNNGGGRDGGA